MGAELPPPDIKIEDVFESLGGYGRYQKILTFAIFWPQFATAMMILSPVFTGSDKVPLFCRDKAVFLEAHECLHNCTAPTGDEVYTSVVQEWELVCSKSWIVDAVTSCQMVGTMAGALISSVISDRYGRKMSYYIVVWSLIIFGILPGLAFDPISYAVARFLTGVSAGGVFVVLLVQLMEFLTPSWRTICGCVSLWPPGEMTLGLLAYLVPNWRYLIVLTALPTLINLLFYRVIDESPRWLLTQKRTKEAYQILCKVAKWNKTPPPPADTVNALQSVVLQEEKNVLKGWDGIKQIFQNRRLGIDLLIHTWSTVTCSIVYYGVSFSAKTLSGDPYLNMLYMGILDFLSIPAVLAFNNRIGRKKTYMMYVALGSVNMITIIGLQFASDLTATYPVLVTVFALMGRFCIVAAWAALACAVMETFPTTLRSTCMGFTAFAGYIGGVVAPQTVFLGTIAPSLPYLMYCFMTVTSAFFSLFLNEMAGVPLKDTANA